ncbi:HNH endonuclease [Pseudovibrio denitrificans]|uniref:HNH endonuclease n=1 Tax=Pseudovibrio denitrificans TaxID=258256 RepID=UPI0006D1A3C4|nr:HNH endonuclease signature motif containing protein [Pseudovibrio denitrificans]
MSKKKFSPAERYAVWTVHGEKCWLCGEPLPYTDMHIDHIIPEKLEGTEALKGILEEFALPLDFELNTWANWMPAHATCNTKKLDHVFRPAPIILRQIEHAIAKSKTTQEIHDKYLSRRSLSIALDRVIEGIENGRLTPEQRDRFIAKLSVEHERNRSPEMHHQPIFLSPNLTILNEDKYRYTLKGPSGLIGTRPKGSRIDPSWDCPNCGPTMEWNTMHPMWASY